MRRARGRELVRAIVLAAAAAVASLGPAPRTARADNLADALVGAYNSSGLLEQNRALLRAADEDVAAAMAALRPIVNWTTTVQRARNDRVFAGIPTLRTDTTFFTGLQLDLLLYDGGASRLARQAAQETVLATRQNLLTIEQQVLLAAVAAYVNVLIAEENVRLRQNNLRVLQEELKAAQDRFDVGEVTRTDVALAEARVANSRSGLAAAQGELANARAEYLKSVGHAPGRLAGQPPLPRLPANRQEALAIAYRNHPRILAAQHQVKAAELNVLRAAKAYGPTASLRLQAGITDYVGSADRNNNVAGSITLRQPIFQGGALASAHRRAIAQRDAARGNLLEVKRQIEQAVTDAFVRLTSSRARLAATEEQVRASQVAFDGIREEAKLGARTTLDVLIAEQELLDALTLRNQARGELSFAAYQVLFAQGLLTAEHLGLAVQIYDPTLYYNLVKDAPARLSRRGRDLDRVLQALGRK